MGSWSYERIGVSVDKSKETLAKRVMECFDIRFEDEDGWQMDWVQFGEGPSEQILKGCPDVVGDSKDAFVNQYGLYRIMRRIFDNVDVYWAMEEGSTISDAYFRKECHLQGRTKKEYTACCQYCEGEGLVGEDEENAFRRLRDEIEAEAKKKNISISWISDGDDPWDDLYPDDENDEFYSLAYDIYDKRFKEIATEFDENEIPEMENESGLIEIVSALLAGAKKRGYKDVENLIAEKFSDLPLEGA